MIDPRRFALGALVLFQIGCPRPEGTTDAPAASTKTTEPASDNGASASAKPKAIAKASADETIAVAAPTTAVKEPDPVATYKWLGETEGGSQPARVDSLQARFAPPAGFSG